MHGPAAPAMRVPGVVVSGPLSPRVAAHSFGGVRSDDRSARSILLFWLPLAAQWLMMALEGPFLAAVIARLLDPAFNLAAHGVAYAFAILVESPVIMLMSASTALVTGAESYRKLRNFANALNAFSTAILLLVLIPSVHAAIMERALGLPPDVAALVYGALWLLLPWPAAIGYRRFLHGVMIRSGRTRLVAYGTVLRLAAMAGTAAALAVAGLPGAWVGAASLSAGVVVEAIAAKVMAAGAIRDALSNRWEAAVPVRDPEAVAEAGAGAEGLVGEEAAERRSGRATPDVIGMGYSAIARFYYPLALTSLIGLTVQPMLTFFMGRAPSPIESLAVFPVVHALSFLFRSLGLSFQEAAIALLGSRCEHIRPISRFGAALALAASAGLALVAFTPLSVVWFETVSGLPHELAALAITPTRILVPLPALSVVLSLQRAVLVQQRTTRPITVATAIEVVTIAVLFPVFGWGLGLVGVTSAMLAFLAGRVASVLFLAPRTWAAVRDGTVAG
jgi:progressive ankylosis protein